MIIIGVTIIVLLLIVIWRVKPNKKRLTHHDILENWKRNGYEYPKKFEKFINE